MGNVIDLRQPVLGEVNEGAFYTVTDVTNPRAVAARMITYLQYQLWLGYVDCDDQVASVTYGRLSRETGVTPARARRILDALAMLEFLPRFRGVIARHMHVDLDTLVGIASVLEELDAEDEEYRDRLLEFDSLLTDFLTPDRAREVMPRKRAIMAMMRVWLKEIDPEIAHGDFTDRDYQILQFRPLEFGMVLMEGVIDSTDAEIIQQVLHQHAKNLDIPLHQALLDILQGGQPPKATLNVVTIDDPEAPLWVEGVGYVDQATKDFLEGLICSTRQIGDVALSPSAGYETPRLMQLVIKARDGVCMVPGCERSAASCDCDHVRNHDQGGPTCPCNLVSLCRAHHNEKTEGRLAYSFDHRRCEAHFQFADGTTAVSSCQGPLSPKGVRWMRTVAQMRRQRQVHARERAVANTRRRQRYFPEPIVTATKFDDTPPPF